jgi:hypothetical protein
VVTDPLAAFWVHEVTVEHYSGPGPEGPSYGTAYLLPCFIDAKRRLVRSATGEQVASSVTVFAPPGAPLVPVGSRITLPGSHGGHQTRVITTSNADGGGLPTPDHVEISCE